MTGRTVDLDVDGTAAPPRRNGELAFDEPWQSRLFGLTMALCESGAIDWDDFRARLIAHIGAWDADAAGEATVAEHAYWDHWQAAFTDVVTEAGILSGAQVDDLAVVLAARPDGHDHAH